jgi:mannose-1-phosphate guanylyltransferase/mannose-6-phosphate isomerase
MADGDITAYAALLAGGVGSRLWPLSRELYPKQLVRLIGDDSLVQSTAKRLMPVLDGNHIRVVCGREHYHEIARHLDSIGIDSEGKVITEPCGRNTAPAVLLAVLHILATASDPVICVFPADHVIRNVDQFHDKLRSAIQLAGEGHIVTFGIRPDYPETGYGYIEGADPVAEGALVIRRFVEKPDKKAAQQYIDAGNYFWNSGMFAFKASVILEEFRRHQPVLLETMTRFGQDPTRLTESQYAALPEVSIDVAIMEKTDKGVVLPSDFGWSDIGSWKSLYELLPKDKDNNVFDGDVIARDTRNSLVLGRQRLIAVNRLNRIVVVETPDSIFVSDMEHSRDVKAIVARLKEKGRQEYHRHRAMVHPWGIATLLEMTDSFHVTHLEIYPGSTYSTHSAETEAAVSILSVAAGAAGVGVEEDGHRLSRGESIKIAGGQEWKITNPGKKPLEMIRVDLFE